MTNFDETVDFVVVGSGAGSMCASLIMRDQGKNVVVLEKAELVGGTTARSGGVMWIPNNRFLKRDGIEDSYDKAKTYLDSLMEGNENIPGSTPERRHRFLVEAPNMLEYLISKGIKFDRVDYWPDYYDEKPGGIAEGRTVVAQLFDLRELGPWRKKFRKGFLPLPIMLSDALNLNAIKYEWSARWMFLKFAGRLLLQLLTGKRRVAAGAALQGQMLKATLAAGVDIRTESPVSELIIEDDVVKGVLTVKDGKPWRIASLNGVLVNAGGFARNQAMRDKYQPGTRAEWSNAVESDTGDLIQEMMRQGAAVNNLDMMVGYQSTIPPGKENDMVKPGAQKMGALPHAILVDQSGVRYMNEGGSYVAFCRTMLDRHEVSPAIPGWVVTDSLGVRKYGIAGGRRKSTLRKWELAGFLKKADTVEGLAMKMGADPALLKSNVERFNGFARNNKDEDFHRGERAYDNWLGDRFNQPSATLGVIEKSPFYAVPVIPGDVSTYGGVVTNENAQVLKQDGSIIQGLYATGVSTASPMGRVYPGAGASIGPAYTYGYIAARHVLGLD